MKQAKLSKPMKQTFSLSYLVEILLKADLIQPKNLSIHPLFWYDCWSNLVGLPLFVSFRLRLLHGILLFYASSAKIGSHIPDIISSIS